MLVKNSQNRKKIKEIILGPMSDAVSSDFLSLSTFSSFLVKVQNPSICCLFNLHGYTGALQRPCSEVMCTLLLFTTMRCNTPWNLTHGRSKIYSMNTEQSFMQLENHYNSCLFVLCKYCCWICSLEHHKLLKVSFKYFFLYTLYTISTAKFTFIIKKE